MALQRPLAAAIFLAVLMTRSLTASACTTATECTDQAKAAMDNADAAYATIQELYPKLQELRDQRQQKTITESAFHDKFDPLAHQFSAQIEALDKSAQQLHAVFPQLLLYKDNPLLGHGPAEQYERAINSHLITPEGTPATFNGKDHIDYIPSGSGGQQNSSQATPNVITNLTDTPPTKQEKKTNTKDAGESNVEDPADVERTANTSQKPQDFAKAGQGFLKNNDPQRAAANFDQSLKRDQNNVDARVGRAQARAAMGDREGAIADAKAALALDPKNRIAMIIAGHGDAIAQGGSRMKVNANFGADKSDGDAVGGGANPWSAKRGPGFAPTQNASPQAAGAAALTMAQSLVAQALDKLRMNDVTGALLAARQAVDAEPKNPAAWATLAEVSNAAGNAKGALEAAKKALEFEPQNPQALRAKAYAEFQLGDYHSAYEDALAAIKLDPQNGLGYLYLAMAEEKLGMTADALKHYEQAVSLDTTLAPLAQEAIRRLKGSSGGGMDVSERSHLVKGGAVAGGLILLLFGILGVAAKKTITTTAQRILSGKESEAPTVLDAAPVIGPGTLLAGTFRITGELGRGGMGVVYDATDETLRRRVAIKRLSRDGATSEDRERFLKEARLVASLKHPNLAEIYSVINDGELYLVFERIDGEPLDRLLKTNIRLDPQRARRILSEIASALDCAHAQKIIHRDLKPSNIMIAKDGTAKVMDFGIAHQAHNATSMTQTGASGTPPYMAPEQAFGSVSKASDFYALAVMAYELLTGARPFEGPDFLEEKLQKRWLPPSQRNADLRRELDGFFARALDPDPTKRPPDGKAFLRGFDEACAAVGRPA